MYKQTKVTPREHYIDNFGTDVQAITFSYNGTVHSINRRGKRNILGFIGASGTYTFTNGTDKFLRMNPYGVELISWTGTDGVNHTSFARV